MENKFPIILKKLRKEKHLSQEELAKKFDLTCSTISRYEIGIREPDQELLQKFADFFHVSIDYLLGRETIHSQISEEQTEYDLGKGLNKAELEELKNYQKFIESKRVLPNSTKEHSATKEEMEQSVMGK